jgi:hypothetical protein
VQTRDFRWDLTFTFAKNKNEVVSMPESLADEDGNVRVSIDGFSAGNDAITMYAEKGKPIGQYYTYRPQYTADGKLIVDANGQPDLTEEIEDTGKNMNHDWTGGLMTSFTAYGVTLSATLDVRYGGYMFSRTRNLMQFTGNGTVTTYNDRRPFIIPNSVVSDGNGGYVENTTPIQQIDGSYQTYFNDYGYGLGGEAYLLDRTYAKLRNITISYDLPKKWIGPLSGVSVSAFVNNAFIWTPSENIYIDPEQTTEGTDLAGTFGELYSNPACRVYGFNLGIKF